MPSAVKVFVPYAVICSPRQHIQLPVSIGCHSWSRCNGTTERFQFVPVAVFPSSVPQIAIPLNKNIQPTQTSTRNYRGIWETGIIILILKRFPHPCSAVV